MGGIKNRDLLSTKYLNAIINMGNRFFVVHVKQYLGSDLFLAKIERKYYLFKIDPSRIKLNHHFGVQSVSKIDYDLSNYRPIDEKQIADLENILNTNSLSKVDRKLFKLFDILGRREKSDLNADGTLKHPHNLTELLAEAEKYKGEDEAVLEIIEYMRHLDIKQIVTPVKKLSEFLYKELKETDPGFADEVFKRALATEQENKKMTNTPITGKSPILKIVVVLMLVGVIVAVIAYGASTGAFGHLPTIGGGGGSFGGIPGLSGSSAPSGPLSASSPVSAWASAYPTPQALENGINSHQIACTQLPKEVKDMVNTLPSHVCP